MMKVSDISDISVAWGEKGSIPLISHRRHEVSVSDSVPHSYNPPDRTHLLYTWTRQSYGPIHRGLPKVQWRSSGPTGPQHAKDAWSKLLESVRSSGIVDIPHDFSKDWIASDKVPKGEVIVFLKDRNLTRVNVPGTKHWFNASGNDKSLRFRIDSAPQPILDVLRSAQEIALKHPPTERDTRYMRD